LGAEFRTLLRWCQWRPTFLHPQFSKANTEQPVLLSVTAMQVSAKSNLPSPAAEKEQSSSLTPFCPQLVWCNLRATSQNERKSYSGCMLNITAGKNWHKNWKYAQAYFKGSFSGPASEYWVISVNRQTCC